MYFSYSLMEACEPRRLFAAQALSMTDASETVIMWKDSTGYNRFGPAVGSTWYFDSSGNSPVTSYNAGRLFRFDASITHFDVSLFGGNDFFGVQSSNNAGVNFYINAGEGNDSVTGWISNDTLVTNSGNDLLDGHSGNDTLTVTGPGSVTLYGGNGDDILGSDTRYYDPLLAFGGFGNDTITGGSGADVLYGEAGNDVIKGGNKQTHDTLSGGDGADTLYGSYIDLLTINTTGSKVLYGNAAGAGDDGDADIFLETSLLDMQSEA